MAQAPLADDAVDWVSEDGKAEMKIDPTWTPTGNAPTTGSGIPFTLEGEWTFGVDTDGEPPVVRVTTYPTGDATIDNLGDMFWATRDTDADIATSSPVMGPNGRVISFFSSSGGPYDWVGFVSIENGTIAVAEVRFENENYGTEDYDTIDQLGPLLYTIQAK